MKEEKKIYKKYFSLLLVAILFISIFNTITVKAEDTPKNNTNVHKNYDNLFKDGEFQISTITELDTLETDINFDQLAFKLSFDGKEVSAKGTLYKLQGAALYSNAIIADITESSCTILFSTISRGQLIAYDHNTLEESIYNENMVLTCVIRWDNTREIFIIKTLLDNESAAKANVSLDSIQSIDLDNPMYEKLILDGDWYSIYIKENRESLGQIDTVTVRLDELQVPKEQDTTITKIEILQENNIYPYFDEKQNGRDEGCHAIIVKDTNDNVVHFGICDLKLLDGQYIGSVALHNVTFYLTPTTSASENSIEFDVRRTYNYFIKRNAGATLKETDIIACDANSTYVITQNPSIGVRISGDNASEYFPYVRFSKTAGGGKFPSLENITNSVIKTIMGTLCPLIGGVTTVSDLFAEGLEVIEDWHFENKEFKFENIGGLYRKAISASLPAQLYKQNSEIQLHTKLLNIKSNSQSSLGYEYSIEILGSRNATRPNEVIVKTFYGTKTVK